MTDSTVETRRVNRMAAPGVVSPAEKRAETANRKRRPMGVPRKKLEVPVIPGYSVRVMNDIPGRLVAALEGGYEFVTPQEAPGWGQGDVVPGNSDLGDRVSRIVGKTADGQALRAYLMKIKQEWYDEDQATKGAELDKIDAAVRGGQVERKPQDGRYISTISVK